MALQFPEGLKRQAAAISSDLKTAGFDVIISGDPCYGACDLALDTVTEGKADVLVHFGHAPVHERPDVIFEPWTVDFDVSILVQALPLLREKTVGLVTTVQHAHLVPKMEAFLTSHGHEVRVAEGACGHHSGGRCSGAVLPPQKRPTPVRSSLSGPVFSTRLESPSRQRPG